MWLRVFHALYLNSVDIVKIIKDLFVTNKQIDEQKRPNIPSFWQKCWKQQDNDWEMIMVMMCISLGSLKSVGQVEHSSFVQVVGDPPTCAKLYAPSSSKESRTECPCLLFWKRQKIIDRSAVHVLNCQLTTGDFPLSSFPPFPLCKTS